MELSNCESFTKEQLIEEAKQSIHGCQALIRTSPGVEAHRISLCLAEIALASLAAVPVGYINRHTGVFHKPEWMIGDDLDRALYFPVFGAHSLLGGV